MRAARIGIHAAWSLVAVLSVAIGGYALALVATGFQFMQLTNPALAPWGLQTHIAASGVAMLIGAFQFLRVLRQKWPGVHRWLGRIYITACMIGGLAGGAIALSSTAGLFAGWGFLLLAILWVPTTLLALFAAMRRDFADHERWMIRSFALTFAAVTLRLYLPIGAMTVGFDAAYPFIAWLCWVPNLIVAEIWIAMRRRPRQPKPPTAAMAA